MVAVAQLVEHLVVVQVVAGSSPVSHPKETEVRVCSNNEERKPEGACSLKGLSDEVLE